MLTYTISVSIRSTLLRYSLVLSEYLSNHSTCPDTRPDTINTRPRRRPIALHWRQIGLESRLSCRLIAATWILQKRWAGLLDFNYRSSAHFSQQSPGGVSVVSGPGSALEKNAWSSSYVKLCRSPGKLYLWLIVGS